MLVDARRILFPHVLRRHFHGFVGFHIDHQDRLPYYGTNLLRIEQVKGRKDRRVYMSPDLVASLQACLTQHPGEWAKGFVFWNRKRRQQPLAVKAIQKKMERYAKAAGITASCHSLRHTFASNLLEHGAEVVTIRDFLGHSQISSSERYAKVSSQKIKQEYLRTMQKILKQGQV
jgi:site-specific recombinase XerD